MATQIICDFKENDKANPCGTPAVWRISIMVAERSGTSATTTHNVFPVDSCGQHILPLTGGRVADATKPDLGARVVAALGTQPSALGRTVSKVEPDKIFLGEISITPLVTKP